MKKLISILLILAMLLTMASCGTPANNSGNTDNNVPANTNNVPANDSSNSNEASPGGNNDPVRKNNDIVILFTSDIHCAIDQGFGFAGVKAVRDNLESQGYTTILVDDGDAIQGELIGSLSKGETIIYLMNEAGYDVAIPGNHEFDYGMAQFLALTEYAEFPYISCNFSKNGQLVFKPYTIIEAAGKKIAFVGMTTPLTFTTSTPKFFQDDKGEFIYSFLHEDHTGETFYKAVQDAVDAARAEGADYVYAMAHLGMNAASAPWSYADVIEHTSGIDVFLDGHTHDTEQITMKNKDGGTVLRSACGTQLNAIGYSFISADEGIKKTGIWTWANADSADTVFGFNNSISDKVAQINERINEQLSSSVARTAVELTINDPVEKTNEGLPIRMIRRAETNLADLVTDAIRAATGSQIAVMNGGAIRTSIAVGEITYNDIVKVLPFGNQLCMIEATGQQIMDALEWGARSIPGENGAFLQVSGLSYEIDATVPTPCVADTNNMMAEIKGQRRVSNVMVDGKPIDPAAKYTVSGIDYILVNNGDGQTAFNGATLLKDQVISDTQMLIDYIVDTLGGGVGAGYEDPYGQGRIVIKD